MSFKKNASPNKTQNNNNNNLKKGITKSIIEQINAFIDKQGTHKIDGSIELSINDIKLLILFISSDLKNLKIYLDAIKDNVHKEDKTILNQLDIYGKLPGELLDTYVQIIQSQYTGVIEINPDKYNILFTNYLLNLPKNIKNILLKDSQYEELRDKILHKNDDINILKKIINPTYTLRMPKSTRKNTLSHPAPTTLSNKSNKSNKSTTKTVSNTSSNKSKKSNAKPQRKLPERPKPSSAKHPGAAAANSTNHTSKNQTKNNNNNNNSIKKTQQCETNKSFLQSPEHYPNRYIIHQQNYKNQFNACYYHSTLQLLRNIPELISDILTRSATNPFLGMCASELGRDGYPTTSSQKIVDEIVPKQEIIVADKHIMQSPWKLQIDAQEFLSAFIDSLPIQTQELFKIASVTKNIYNDSNTYKPKVKSRFKSENAFIITLPIPQSKQKIIYKTVQDIYNLYSIKGNLELRAYNNNDIEIKTFNAHTQKYTPKNVPGITYSYFNILSTTQYLLIHFKAFERDYKTDITSKLDLHITELNNLLCVDGILFEPISIITHRGSYYGGHYRNHSKQRDSKNNIIWYMYDDAYNTADIKLLHNKQLDIDNATFTPYIMLYKRLL